VSQVTLARTKAWEWEPRKPLKGMTRAGWRSNAPLRKPMIGSPAAGEAMLDIAPTTVVPEP
jgi:hypothetical protein